MTAARPPVNSQAVESDDGTLVGRARDGAVEAFSELVRRYQHRVRGYVAGLTGDEAVVDDVAQEAFLAAYRSLDEYDGSAPFGAWLCGIARFRALAHFRDERRRRACGLDRLDLALLDGRIEQAQAEIEAVETDRAEQLARCLAELPERSRALIAARYEQARSIADLAALSGRAETAVRMALSRIRAVLRRCIEQREACTR